MEYSTIKNKGIELDMPGLRLNYNYIGMMAAAITLVWYFLLNTANYTQEIITLMAIEKYFTFVLLIVIYKRVTFSYTHPVKLRIEEDGLTLLYKSGSKAKVITDKFIVDNTAGDVMDKTLFFITQPAKIIIKKPGEMLGIMVDDTELSKLKE